MTRILASVAGPDGAVVALENAADIIEATGAISYDTIRATMAAVGGRRPVCACIGRPSLSPDVLQTTATSIVAIGVEYLKIEILSDRDVEHCLPLAAKLATQVRLIGVLSAEKSLDLPLLTSLARSGFVAAMLDTKYDIPKRLLDQFDVARLQGFVRTCQNVGLHAGLAGALEPPDIPRLMLLAPDILGFDQEYAQAARALLPLDPAADEVEYRRPLIRRHAAAEKDAAEKEGPTDRVLVNGFVLPVLIGAYARECQTPQRVRFTVAASVRRPVHLAADMRDVFSYDLITDGIRLLVNAGHVPLVETLAERVADMVLAYPLVTNVVVRVEKLDTGPASVGIEIERNPSQTQRTYRAALLSDSLGG